MATANTKHTNIVQNTTKNGINGRTDRQTDRQCCIVRNDLLIEQKQRDNVLARDGDSI